MPCITMTWEKFNRTVIPTAVEIDFLVPFKNSSYTAFVTAVNPDSPPIINWDVDDDRNPVSWYVYNDELRGGGSPARQWGLISGKFYKVTAICLQPSMWNSNFKNHGESVTFMIEGAIDSCNSSLALFPEILKSEFHAIRSTIEAYSRSRSLEGSDKASACGVRLQKGIPWTDFIFNVTNNQGTVIQYNLDRWD
jgi:hypothetical protein